MSAPPRLASMLQGNDADVKQLLQQYLAAGGDPNYVPLFASSCDELWFGKILCCPCYFTCGVGHPNIHKYGNMATLLHWCALFGQIESIKLLVASGADLGRKTDKPPLGGYNAYEIGIFEKLPKEVLDLLNPHDRNGVSRFEEGMKRVEEDNIRQMKAVVKGGLKAGVDQAF